MQFWKPGETLPTVYNPREMLSLKDQRKELPVYKYRDQLVYLVETNSVLIVVGETGSGKTTQIPQYLYESGWAKDGRVVACTQPRRIAATTIASRVAEEMNVSLGNLVGYSVRFDDATDPTLTRIKYMTDGMLFREALMDPLLSKYSCVMIDEAHERSLYTDALLGILKKILVKRKELKIIVSSATLDAKKFLDFFQQGVILSIDGKMYPTDVYYLQNPTADYVLEAVETALKIHSSEPNGDILCFLTGREEIERAVQMVQDTNTKQLNAYPLYGGLPMEQQLLAFKPSKYRKVVFATNIAEASITIDGIVYVIDCGFVKQRVYQPKTNSESLVIVPTSKASAIQRAGRAGRTCPGKVYRLYPESSFQTLPDHSIPEIQRCNLCTLVLQLKALGIDNILSFDFLSPPPAENMIRSLDILYSLKTLDDDGKLTEFGAHVAEFPLDPCLSTFLLNSARFGCTQQALTISAMISTDDVWITNPRKEAQVLHRQFSVIEGDHLSFLNVYNAYIRNNSSSKWCHSNMLHHKALEKAVSIRNQLSKAMRRFGYKINTSTDDVTIITKTLVTGFFHQVAKLNPDGSYQTLLGQTLAIHPNSILFKFNPTWLMYHEVVETTNPFMKHLTSIEPSFLKEIAPHYYS